VEENRPYRACRSGTNDVHILGSEISHIPQTPPYQYFYFFFKPHSINPSYSNKATTGTRSTKKQSTRPGRKPKQTGNMKSGKPVLYPNEAVSEAVTDYSEEHSLGLPQHLLDYHAEVVTRAPSSNYMISTFQAQALVFLAHLAGAKRGM
jgi:hypothetical protein